MYYKLNSFPMKSNIKSLLSESIPDNDNIVIFKEKSLNFTSHYVPTKHQKWKWNSEVELQVQVFRHFSIIKHWMNVTIFISKEYFYYFSTHTLIPESLDYIYAFHLACTTTTLGMCSSAWLICLLGGIKRGLFAGSFSSTREWRNRKQEECCFSKELTHWG